MEYLEQKLLGKNVHIGHCVVFCFANGSVLHGAIPSKGTGGLRTNLGTDMHGAAGFLREEAKSLLVVEFYQIAAFER